jgi:hypothetical protein
MKGSISRSRGRAEREDDDPDLSQFLEGVFASVVIASLLGLLVYALRSLAPSLPSLYWYAGIAQLLYVAPLTVAFHQHGNNPAVLGVLAIAAAVLLLNGVLQGLAGNKSHVYVRIGSSSRGSSRSTLRKRGSSRRPVSRFPIAESMVSFKCG